MGKKGAKRHQKRLAAPATYQIPRREKTFTFHGKPGAHGNSEGIPLGIVFRDILHYAQNRKELKYILNTKGILVDNKAINDTRYVIGPMDVISVPAMKKHYRVLHWQGRRKLNIVEIDEEHSHWKLLKVRSKTTLKHGHTQVNCSSGKNIYLPKSESGKYESKWDDPSTYVTKGTIKYDVENKKVLDFFPFKEGASVLVKAGVNTGKWGHLQHFEKRIGKNRSICMVKTPDEGQIITAMENLFVIGSEQPELFQYQHNSPKVTNEE